MSNPNSGVAGELEQWRAYLKLLADIQLNARLRGKVDASDVVQLTLLEAHRDQAAYRGTTDAELLAWVKIILSRNLLNVARHYRAEKRSAERERSLDQQLEQSSARLAQFLCDNQSTPSQNIVREEQAERLTRALATLREEERAAVVWKHFHGWPIAEIAVELGRTNDAVVGLLRRGLKKLRSELDGLETT